MKKKMKTTFALIFSLVLVFISITPVVAADKLPAVTGLKVIVDSQTYGVSLMWDAATVPYSSFHNFGYEIWYKDVTKNDTDFSKYDTSKFTTDRDGNVNNNRIFTATLISGHTYKFKVRYIVTEDRFLKSSINHKSSFSNTVTVTAPALIYKLKKEDFNLNYASVDDTNQIYNGDNVYKVTSLAPDDHKGYINQTLYLYPNLNNQTLTFGVYVKTQNTGEIQDAMIRLRSQNHTTEGMEDYHQEVRVTDQWQYVEIKGSFSDAANWVRATIYPAGFSKGDKGTILISGANVHTNKIGVW